MILVVFWILAAVCFLGGWWCGYAMTVQDTADYHCVYCGRTDTHTSTCVVNHGA